MIALVAGVDADGTIAAPLVEAVAFVIRFRVSPRDLDHDGTELDAMGWGHPSRLAAGLERVADRQ